ncbi:cell wall-binding repeat-containing protein [Herbiconiux flava]|uniref:Putative cell wall-binding protein n=1 Tax=Herbiconiux flava TaxID=881268 RepID=A0A852SQN0_9MICO|nr:cell wall-binding repeat-containing protein [Herbiconiux flava]NYD71054.1 putative cell wall-binding protein [Herbiconiux flava]GLK18983.1 hypothetical protein GCM10017602_34650 [Herbiconiux flava]
MTLILSPRRLAFGAFTAVAALAAAVLPTVGASATTAALVPNCPQELSAVGFPITPTDLVTPVAAPAVLEVELSGTLPDGVRFYSDDHRAYFHGSPTKVQTTSVGVYAVVRNGGSSFSVEFGCSFSVKPAPSVSRIGGKDRFAQSALVSRANFTDVDTVYLASGEKFPDALGAASVAAAHGSPLLLTPSTQVTAEVMTEIARVTPKNVVVVGGPAAVAPAVIDQLQTVLGSKVTVTRIGGADRFEVSRNLIGDDAFGIASSKDVFIATGTNFPDALGASPAAALVDAPVLLVDGAASTLTAAEKSTLTGLGATTATIVGGGLAVSLSLETDIAKSYMTSRVGGVDRFEVNAALTARSFVAPLDTLYLASGSTFPDALSGGAAAGADGDALAITAQNCVSAPTAMTIGRLVPSKVVILGGTASLDTPLDTLKLCHTE